MFASLRFFRGAAGERRGLGGIVRVGSWDSLSLSSADGGMKTAEVGSRWKIAGVSRGSGVWARDPSRGRCV